MARLHYVPGRRRDGPAGSATQAVNPGDLLALTLIANKNHVVVNIHIELAYYWRIVEIVMAVYWPNTL
jgi:hypothetical protein